MPVKIKTDIKGIRKVTTDARSQASRQIKRSVVNLVKSDVDKGLSPVKGMNKFRGYAPSTAKKKGRKSPVDLRDTEQAMNSLTAIQKATGRIQMLFRGARNDKIMTFHHEGTPNMPARWVLPWKSGLTFKKRIIDAINKIIQKNVDLAVNKANN